MTPLDTRTVPLAGGHLVEASAGTGKTHAITNLYLRLIVEGEHTTAAVLVVTYTRAATAELKTRLRARLLEALEQLDDDTSNASAIDADLTALVDRWRSAGMTQQACERLKHAIRTFDESAIFTIHGFCQRALRELAFEANAPLDVELLTDETLLREEITGDLWAETILRAPAALFRGKGGLGYRHLERVIGRASAHTKLRILPDSTHEDSTLETTTAAWLEAHAAAGALWRERQEEILAALTAMTPDGKKTLLNMRTYGEARVLDLWVPELDRAFREGDPEPPFHPRPKSLEKLIPAAIIKATKVRQDPPEHPFFEACEALLEADVALCASVEQERTRTLASLCARYATERSRRQRNRGSESFDDLLVRLHAGLQSSPALGERLRARFPVALVDEFQDTDPIQSEIFETIYGSGGTLFAIGDPKQAIFGFRGADVHAYVRARERLTAGSHTLATNWRSHPDMVNAVNTIFGHHADPFANLEIPFRPSAARVDFPPPPQGIAPGIEILLLEGEGRPHRDDMIDVAAGEIAAILDGGDRSSTSTVVGSDIAVLSRTNKEAIAMQEALRNRGVRSVLHGDQSVFMTTEADEVERILLALADPAHAVAVRTALVSTPLGVPGLEIAAMQSDAQSSQWDAWVERFDRWRLVWGQRGVLPAFRGLLDESDAPARILALVDGERRMTNLLHVGELLHRAATDEHLGPNELIRWLHGMRTDARARATYASEATQIRLESDARAVILTTIHKAKGLEYEIVYCPTLWSSARPFRDDTPWPLFHDATANGALTLDLGSEQSVANQVHAAHEALAEHRRLLYVALTRAKIRTTIVWGALETAPHSAFGSLITSENAPSTSHDWLEPLHALASNSEGTIDLRSIQGPATQRAPTRGIATPSALTTPPPAPRIHGGTRVSSFTGLVASEEASTHGPVDRAPDHDADVEGTAPPILEDNVAVDLFEHAGVALGNLPPGAKSGRLVHEIFERAAFDAASPEQRQEAIAAIMGRYAMPLELTEEIAAMVATVLEVGLPPTGIKLGDVAPNRRVAEMDFTLPVGTPLSPRSLAEAFRTAGSHDDTAYADQLAALSFRTLHGYLRGFIDLVFEAGGRWYVLDYKTNHLGDRRIDYTPARLRGEMERHHYTLQAHLYSVALDRFLATRIPDYDYEQHFGGFHYLFVRGMARDATHDPGVYFERPSLERIQALRALFPTPPRATN